MLAIRPSSKSKFQFIPKVFDKVKVRALCRPVKFFYTDLDKPFLYGLCFVHRGIVMLIQKRAFPNLPQNCDDFASRGSLELSECCNRGQTFYTVQHAAGSFCELVWHTTLRLSRCCS